MNEIQIGLQIWAKENVTITKFRNGDDIPFVPNRNEWSELTSPAYCINENNNYLYNYWAIIDSKNIAPLGWRIPTENDWDILINHLGGKDNAGYKLKSIDGWLNEVHNFETGQIITQNFGGTNEVDFNATPIGFRHMDGNYATDLLCAFFIPESIDENLCKYLFLFSGNEFGKGGMWKKDGFSIRLIKE
jgi:uncharacterized protein (TIGR02145 family)